MMIEKEHACPSSSGVSSNGGSETKMKRRSEVFAKGIAPHVKGAFALLVISLIVVGHVIIGIQERHAAEVRITVLKLLQAMESPIIVRIGGIQVEESHSILDALSTLDKHRAHHSRPVDHFTVAVESGTNALTLSVARDSEIKTEYWVSAPSQYSRSHIGSIRTEALNEY
jgi:hypothetical protein